MIQVVLFDADGVLITGSMFSEDLEREYGITKEKTDPFFQNEFQECLTGGRDLKEAVAPHLAEWGFPGTVDDLLDVWFRFEGKLNQPLIDAIQQVRIRDVRCYIATNQEKYRATHMLKVMGFRDGFEGMFVSSDLGAVKPSDEYFTKVMERLQGVPKEDVLFWDDSQKAVDAARAFGLHAELYTNLEDFKQKMETYLRPQ